MKLAEPTPAFKMQNRRRIRDNEDEVHEYSLDPKRKSTAVGSEIQGFESSEVKLFFEQEIILQGRILTLTPKL